MKNNLGFTLIELLIVVLIIGILAAIALPQYKMAVGKAKFAELKSRARTVNEAMHRFYLIHNEYPSALSDLDVTFQDNDVSCYPMKSTKYFACYRKIFGVTINYYILKENYQSYLCYVYNPDLNHPANILCAKEAHARSPNCYDDHHCVHYYQ